MCPGNNESAGKHRSTHTRSGDPWLQSALVEAGWSAIRTKDCYLAVRFWRIAKRRGQQRALIAIAHTLLIIIWHMLKDGTIYTEIGADYLARNDAYRFFASLGALIKTGPTHTNVCDLRVVVVGE